MKDERMITVSPPQIGCIGAFGMQPLREQPVHKRIPFTKSVTISAMNRPTSRKLIVVITDAQGMILLRGRDCTPKHFHPDWEVEANQPWWSWRQPGKLNLCQFDRKKHIAHATG